MGEPITDLLIAGRPAPGEGAPIEVENPATEQVAATVSSASPGQVDQAVAAAGEAFVEWSRMPAIDRAPLLRQVADALLENTDESALLMNNEI
ncbi:MAG: aldehyde dehydrogenase family protein [Solirubrobacterales bacterium]